MPQLPVAPLIKLTDPAVSATPAGGAGFALTPAGTVPRTLRDSYRIDFMEQTAGGTVSATVEGTPTDIITGNTVFLDGKTDVVVAAYVPAITTGASVNSQVILNFWDNTLNVGQVWSSQQIAATRYPGVYVTVVSSRGGSYPTPADGAHVFKLSGWRVTSDGTWSAGAAGSGASTAAWLRVFRA